MNLTVTVCTGPDCSQLGSREILATLRRLPAAQRARVQLETRQCFSRCQEAAPLCPCVRIGSQWVVQAEASEVKRKVRQHLAAADADLS